MKIAMRAFLCLELNIFQSNLNALLEKSKEEVILIYFQTSDVFISLY